MTTDPVLTRPVAGLSAETVAAATAPQVLTWLKSSTNGLSGREAADRLARYGPNVIHSHRVSAVAIMARQFRNAVLILLVLTAIASFALDDRPDAIIIAVILTVSAALGFVNEYRAENATVALHAQVRHTTLVRRDGTFVDIDVTQIVPGDVLRLSLGAAVPADARLIETLALECDESILSGESAGTEKSAAPVAVGAGLVEMTDIAFMGTIVTGGEALAVVYATGAEAQFGRLATGLGDRAPETEFQVGLRRFSYLLVQVALALVVFIFLANLMQHRPAITSALFALTIAVGITPQLLPAVVNSSLATGSRRLAKVKVLIKRLVCIEDLGDIDILLTDKTGTLTEGRIGLIDAVDVSGEHSDLVLQRALLACDVDLGVGGAATNALDSALWKYQEARQLVGGDVRRLALLPFDHSRRATSALLDDRGERLLVTKGAPEQILARCVVVPSAAEETLANLFAAGHRVVAVAVKPAPGRTEIGTGDESDLMLVGFCVFADEPKAAARESLERLAALGIEVKVATGDNAVVAERVCAELGLVSRGTVTGSALNGMSEEELRAAVRDNTIFARLAPEQKAALIKAARHSGRSVGYLGDGVNDALALHAADVGISVDSATDVAKDAADVILLEKDLGVLATGVAEGRRIFANTIKYVLMGTSSNFGNMFSAAAASAVLPFLPMLPSQVLINNLLYDTSQLAIPTDRVDDEQLRSPSHWDIAFVRRFMLMFGPISSLFDFLTFGFMLGILHAGATEFHTGWFLESLATQTLIVFAIRTRKVPFLRSRPSAVLTVTALSVIGGGLLLTVVPVGRHLGFVPLPWQFFLALAVFLGAYLLLVEVTKKMFYGESLRVLGQPRRVRGSRHRIQRRARRFSL